jgi:Ca-activated chloride channel family protein
MSFQWPWFLYSLAIIPVLAVLYIWAVRRRQRFAVRYSSLALVRNIVPAHSWMRRHLPFILFLLALVSLAIALARPVAITVVPANKTTIVLAIDVSRSMCSTDVAPNRLQAAQAAARSFVRSQASNAQIGVVAFSTFAELIQAPTTDRAALEEAINSLLVGRRTAIGSAILQSINAIAEVDKNVVPSIPDPTSGNNVAPVPKGDYAPDIIVLLTDGSSNTGPLPLAAAQEAADRGIRVYSIGFGTPQGSEFPDCGQQVVGNEPFFGGGGGSGGGQFFGGGGGGGFGFGGFRRGIDEATLKQIASMTGASYYSAESASQLAQVFHELPTNLIAKHETTEITAAFAAAGTLLVALAMLLTLLWHPIR